MTMPRLAENHYCGSWPGASGLVRTKAASFAMASEYQHVFECFQVDDHRRTECSRYWRAPVFPALATGSRAVLNCLAAAWCDAIMRSRT
jgi:hypothetical protein